MRTAEELTKDGAAVYTVPEGARHRNRSHLRHEAEMTRVNEETMSSIKLTMLRIWQNVDEVTRDV
jgi:hypothetical protein